MSVDSAPDLRRLYLKYNQVLWGGCLPHDVAIFWAPCGKAVGLTFLGSSDDGEPAPLVITIDPCLMGLKRFARQTVVHEMAHVHLWPLGNIATHGDLWDAEIQRLMTYRAFRKML
jgi:predicted SprT family Zn-dependent metalloprotease